MTYNSRPGNRHPAKKIKQLKSIALPQSYASGASEAKRVIWKLVFQSNHPSFPSLSPSIAVYSRLHIIPPFSKQFAGIPPETQSTVYPYPSAHPHPKATISGNSTSSWVLLINQQVYSFEPISTSYHRPTSPIIKASETPGLSRCG